MSQDEGIEIQIHVRAFDIGDAFIVLILLFLAIPVGVVVALRLPFVLAAIPALIGSLATYILLRKFEDGYILDQIMFTVETITALLRNDFPPYSGGMEHEGGRVYAWFSYL